MSAGEQRRHLGQRVDEHEVEEQLQRRDPVRLVACPRTGARSRTVIGWSPFPLAQAGGAQPGDQLAAADRAGRRARWQHRASRPAGRSGRPGTPGAGCPAPGEGMQLVVRRVADQVAPKPVPKWPDGFVHEHGHGHNAAVTECLLAARALVVHDLAARGMDTARNVSIVDEVLSARRWWVEQWPDGAGLRRLPGRPGRAGGPAGDGRAAGRCAPCTRTATTRTSCG